jgi:hypothetical protein
MISLDTLHPDIAKAEQDYPHGPIKEVIDPSPGLWGGEPIDGLVTLIYVCSRNACGNLIEGHTHHALYGPVIVHFADSCKVCGKLEKYYKHEDHIFEAYGEEVLDMEHRTLYAD